MDKKYRIGIVVFGMRQWIHSTDDLAEHTAMLDTMSNSAWVLGVRTNQGCSIK